MGGPIFCAGCRHTFIPAEKWDVIFCPRCAEMPTGPAKHDGQLIYLPTSARRRPRGLLLSHPGAWRDTAIVVAYQCPRCREGPQDRVGGWHARVGSGRIPRACPKHREAERARRYRSRNRDALMQERASARPPADFSPPSFGDEAA